MSRQRGRQLVGVAYETQLGQARPGNAFSHIPVRRENILLQHNHPARGGTAQGKAQQLVLVDAGGVTDPHFCLIGPQHRCNRCAQAGRLLQPVQLAPAAAARLTPTGVQHLLHAGGCIDRHGPNRIGVKVERALGPRRKGRTPDVKVCQSRWGSVQGRAVLGIQ